MYHVVEEASGAVYANLSILQDAIADAKSREGKYLVVNDKDQILFDSQPDVSYKF